MAFVVTKNVHVDHDDIADMFVEGAYHQDQAALFNAIGRRFSGDEPKHLKTMAGDRWRSTSTTPAERSSRRLREPSFTRSQLRNSRGSPFQGALFSKYRLQTISGLMIEGDQFDAHVKPLRLGDGRHPPPPGRLRRSGYP